MKNRRIAQLVRIRELRRTLAETAANKFSQAAVQATQETSLALDKIHTAENEYAASIQQIHTDQVTDGSNKMTTAQLSDKLKRGFFGIYTAERDHAAKQFYEKGKKKKALEKRNIYLGERKSVDVSHQMLQTHRRTQNIRSEQHEESALNDLAILNGSVLKAASDGEE